MADVVHVVSKCSFSFSAVSHNEKLFPPFLCNAFKFVAFAEVHDKAATSNKKRGKKDAKDKQRKRKEHKRAQEQTSAKLFIKQANYHIAGEMSVTLTTTTTAF